MVKIELIPTLEHCIETVARMEYEVLLKQALASLEISKETEERLETLRLFLETADFKKLRAESEKELMNGKKVTFDVYLDAGRPVVKMQAG